MVREDVVIRLIAQDQASQAVNKVTGSMNNLQTQTKVASGTITTNANVVSDAVTGQKTFGYQIGKTTGALSSFGSAIGRTTESLPQLGAAMGAVSGPMRLLTGDMNKFIALPMIAALGGVTIGMKLFEEATRGVDKELLETVDGYRDAINGTNMLLSGVEKTITKLDAEAASFDSLQHKITQFLLSSGGINTVAKDTMAAMDRQALATIKSSKVTAEQYKRMLEAKDMHEDYTGTLGDEIKQLRLNINNIDSLIDTAEAEGKSTTQLTSAKAAQTYQIKLLNNEIDKSDIAYNNMVDAIQNAEGDIELQTQLTDTLVYAIYRESDATNTLISDIDALAVSYKNTYEAKQKLVAAEAAAAPKPIITAFSGGGGADVGMEWAMPGGTLPAGGVTMPTGVSGVRYYGGKIYVYQQGGIARTPQLAKVAEREPEAIIPLSRMGGNVLVKVFVDGQEIAARVDKTHIRQIDANAAW